MKRAKCIVCASAGAEPLYAGILRCQTCDYVFADVQLTDAELFELYSERFFTGAEYSNYVSDEKIYRRNFARQLQVLRAFLDPVLAGAATTWDPVDWRWT